MFLSCGPEFLANINEHSCHSTYANCTQPAEDIGSLTLWGHSLCICEGNAETVSGPMKSVPKYLQPSEISTQTPDIVVQDTNFLKLLFQFHL